MGARLQNISLGIQYRQASFVPDTAKPDGTVDVVWTTGASVRRYDWFGGREFDEVLSTDPAHVDLSQLNNHAPVLDAHNLWGGSKSVKGVVERAWLDQGKGCATVRFDLKDSEAAEIYRKIKEGFVRGVSVGYEVHEFREIPATKTSRAQLIAERWTPKEISPCPIGADAGAGFRAHSNAPGLPCVVKRYAAPPPPKLSRKGTKTMGGKTKKSAKRGASLTTEAAKALATKWITLVAGDDTKVLDLAMEIMAWNAGEEAADDVAEGESDTPPTPAGEMSAIEEAARDITGVGPEVPEAKVVSALYKLEMRASRSTSLQQGLGAEQERARAEKLKKAQDEGRMTPAEAKLATRRLKEGKLTDADLDEELAIAPKVGPGATPVNPPAPQDPESGPTATRSAPTNPPQPTPGSTPQNPATPPAGDRAWEKAVNADMRAYCETHHIALEDFARSWQMDYPNLAYQKPSDRKN